MSVGPFSPDAPTWTYSGDPSTSLLDAVRFHVQDTDRDMPLITDVEVNYLLDNYMDRYDSVIGVAALAADIIARKFAGVVNVSADGVSVNTADLTQRYRDLARDLREEYKNLGGTGLPAIDNILADFSWDASIDPLNFGVGMHDNPLAGRQAYGNRFPAEINELTS